MYVPMMHVLSHAGKDIEPQELPADILIMKQSHSSCSYIYISASLLV